MFTAMANVGIRARLLAGFALICVLLAATVGYTVHVMSDISVRIKQVVDLRAPVAIAGSQTLASSISTANEAIGETSRSANHVLDASAKVTGAAESLAGEVQAFFVRLRDGGLDRRKADDPNYSGPDRRAGRATSRKAA